MSGYVGSTTLYSTSPYAAQQYLQYSIQYGYAQGCCMYLTG